jgi:hypothetical protein
VIGENPAEAGVRELCRALLLRRRICRRLNFEFQTHFPRFPALSFPLSESARFVAPAGLSGLLAQ